MKRDILFSQLPDPDGLSAGLILAWRSRVSSERFVSLVNAIPALGVDACINIRPESCLMVRSPRRIPAHWWTWTAARCLVSRSLDLCWIRTGISFLQSLRGLLRDSLWG